MFRRPAVKRVGVLIGLLIAVLVVGVFLAGISKIRSSADQEACRLNLKQLGLAVSNYHDTNDRLPPLVDRGDGAETGRGLPSVFALLTQFIEADPANYHSRREPNEYWAHSSVPFTFKFKYEVVTLHGGTANQVQKVFLCPADTTAHDLRDVPMTLPDGTTGYYATGSYSAKGLVPWSTGNLKSFPRGTENTVLMAERPQVCRTLA